MPDKESSKKIIKIYYIKILKVKCLKDRSKIFMPLLNCSHFPFLVSTSTRPFYISYTAIDPWLWSGGATQSRVTVHLCINLVINSSTEQGKSSG